MNRPSPKDVLVVCIIVGLGVMALIAAVTFLYLMANHSG